MIKIFRLTLLACTLLVLGTWDYPEKRNLFAAPASVKTKGPVAPGDSTWQQKWNAIVAEAKKEGTVRIYTIGAPATQKALTEAFQAKYGIKLEFVVGRGAELQPKIQAEQRAGLYLVDIIGQGNNTLLINMKPAGLLGSIEPTLILPEVLDPKAWPDEKMPFSDAAQTVIPMTANAQRYLTYNKTQIKEGELTSYQDVLHPKYKGKIIITDPSISGSGNAFFSHLAHNSSVVQAKDFFRRLLVEQEATVTRDYRAQVEAVAKGKYAIGLGTQGTAVANFIALGAPIANVPLKEVEISQESGVIAIPKKLAHPNAAAVFINWLLTKEGQTIFSRNNGTPVIRKDVPTEGINPIFLVNPGEKVTYDTEEYIMFNGEMAKVAKVSKEIMAAYGK